MSLRTGACREAVRFLLRARELLLVGAAGDLEPSDRRAHLLDPNALVRIGSPAFLVGTIEAGLSEAYYRLGDLKTCREHSVRARRWFGQQVPQSSAGWIAAAIWQGVVRGMQAMARTRARDPDSAPQVAGEIARVQLRLTDTFFYFFLQLPGILWSSIRVVNQCEPAGELPELAQGYAILALLAGAARAHPLANRWARRALRIAERGGTTRNVAWIRSRLAVYQVGECADGPTVRPGCGMRLRSPSAPATSGSTRRLACSMRASPSTEPVSTNPWRCSARPRQASRRSGNRQIECWALMGEGTVLGRLGRNDEAVALCSDALAAIDEKVMKAETISLLGALALARLRTGDTTGALEAAQHAMWHIRLMRPVAYWTQSGIAGATEVLLLLREARDGEGPASPQPEFTE